jgi:hypothetical protein
MHQPARPVRCTGSAAERAKMHMPSRSAVAPARHVADEFSASRRSDLRRPQSRPPVCIVCVGRCHERRISGRVGPVPARRHAGGLSLVRLRWRALGQERLHVEATGQPTSHARRPPRSRRRRGWAARSVHSLGRERTIRETEGVGRRQRQCLEVFRLHRGHDRHTPHDLRVEEEAAADAGADFAQFPLGECQPAPSARGSGNSRDRRARWDWP